MRGIFSAFVFLLALSSSAQTLKFTVTGAPDGPVFLTKYVGTQLHYADTTISKNGVIIFDGSKHHAGMYAIYFPNTSYFDFIHDGEMVDMATDTLDVMGHMVVNASLNNITFYDYLAFKADHLGKADLLNQMYASAGTREMRDSIDVLGRALNTEFVNYQEKVIKRNPDLLVSKAIKASMEIMLPDTPRDARGNVTDSMYVYYYYMKHFWDNVDLTDPRMAHIPAYHARLANFFSSETMVQHPDTIIRYANELLSKTIQTDKNNLMFQYTLAYITDKYYNSPYMGMDKVVWAMGTTYYCPPNSKAHWMSKKQLDEFCLHVQKLGRTLIGIPAQQLTLPDSTETNWINMNSLPGDYTVVVFWDPECDHCLEMIPQLNNLYNSKFKARNIPFYAVASAEGDDDFLAWKKIIRDQKLSFINVGMTRATYNQMMADATVLLRHTNYESLNYPETWDIYTTPMIFILDKNKNILYKKLNITQLEDVLDQLTGHGADPKLYPAGGTH